ncbi:MAG: hypothetical protein KGN34_07080 [Sphingomonadales bacterium]|nr:hypothetical protein [Sphingomonadales bacterium]
MSNATTLPAGFAALEAFVPFWAAGTLAGRDAARLNSTPEERQRFYTVAGELAPAAMDYLDARELASFTPPERTLMNLMLSLAHVALAVELQGDDEAIHAFGARRMPIVRGHADPAVA